MNPSIPLKRINVELSGRCNLACDYCPIHHYAQPIDPSFMKREVFERLLSSFSSLEMIDFSGWGESMLHPEFFDFIGMARENGANNLTLTTNATLLNKSKIINGLLDQPLDAVSLSLDAATPETYAKLRKGGDWNRVLEGIGAWVQRRGGASQPILSANFLLMRENLDEVYEFVRLMDGLGVDEAVFKHMSAVFSPEWRSQPAFGGYFKDDPDDLTLLRDRFFEQIQRAAEAFSVRIYLPESFEAHPTATCRFDALGHLFVRWDGEVSHCCPLAYPTDMESPNHVPVFTNTRLLGNIRERSLDSIWTQEICQAPNRDFSEGRAPAMCKDCIGRYDVSGILPFRNAP